jgi:hypothetical protein
MALATVVTMGGALARDRRCSRGRIVHPLPTRRRLRGTALPTLVGVIGRGFLFCAVFARGDLAFAQKIVGSTGKFATDLAPFGAAPAGASGTAAAYTAVPNQGVVPNLLIGGAYLEPSKNLIILKPVDIGNANIPYNGQNYAGAGYTKPKLFQNALQLSTVWSQTTANQTKAWARGSSVDTIQAGVWGNKNVASFGGKAVVVSTGIAPPAGIGIGMGTDPFSLQKGVYSFKTAIDQTADGTGSSLPSESDPPVSLDGKFLLENHSPDGVASLEFGATASFLQSDQPLWDLKMDLLGSGELSVQFTAAPQLTLTSGTDVQREVLSNLDMSVPGQVTLNSSADFFPLFRATLDASTIPSSTFTVSDFTIATASVPAAPEPSTLVLAGIAGTMLVAYYAGRRRAKSVRVVGMLRPVGCSDHVPI